MKNENNGHCSGVETSGPTTSAGHPFNLGGYESDIQVTVDEKGELASIKIVPMKLDNSWVTNNVILLECMINRELRYGIPLEAILSENLDQQCWPNGQTSDPAIPHAASFEDYICRYLGNRFIPGFLKKYPPKPLSRAQMISTQHWR